VWNVRKGRHLENIRNSENFRDFQLHDFFRRVTQLSHSLTDEIPTPSPCTPTPHTHATPHLLADNDHQSRRDRNTAVAHRDLARCERAEKHAHCRGLPSRLRAAEAQANDVYEPRAEASPLELRLVRCPFVFFKDDLERRVTSTPLSLLAAFTALHTVNDKLKQYIPSLPKYTSW
jgi:hypothetical protein